MSSSGSWYENVSLIKDADAATGTLDNLNTSQSDFTTLPVISLADRKALLSKASSGADPNQLNAELSGKIDMLESGNHSKSNFPRANTSSSLKFIYWNIERGRHWEDQVEFLRDADIILLNEVDYGMARTRNANVAKELALALGVNYVVGVEFLELTKGQKGETVGLEHTENSRGYHCNAILSRLPISEQSIVRLPGIGIWFSRQAPHGEIRLGSRMALFAKVSLTSESSLWAVVTHLDGLDDQFSVLKQKMLGMSVNDRIVMAADWHRGVSGVGKVFDKLDWQNANDMSVPTWKYIQGSSGVAHEGHYDHTDLVGIQGLKVVRKKILLPQSSAGQLLSDHAIVVLEADTETRR